MQMRAIHKKGNMAAAPAPGPAAAPARPGQLRTALRAAAGSARLRSPLGLRRRCSSGIKPPYFGGRRGRLCWEGGRQRNGECGCPAGGAPSAPPQPGRADPAARPPLPARATGAALPPHRRGHGGGRHPHHHS